MRKKFIRKIIRNKIPRWIVLLVDIYIVGNSFILAYLVRFNYSIQKISFLSILIQVFVLILISLFAFLITKQYRGIIRHSGIKDSEIIAKSSLFILVGLLLSKYIVGHLYGVKSLIIPLSIILISFLLNIIFLSVARIFFKYLYSKLTTKVRSSKNIMIYGAGDSGILTSSAFKNDKKSKIIGFIDDDERKLKNKINGIPIYHSSEIDKLFIEEKNIEEIIISIQRISPEKILEITDKFSEYELKIKIVPPLQNWLNGDLKIKQIKEIHIEDLLGREPIYFDNPKLKEEFDNKTILITGAAGSIGSEIAKQITNFNYKQLILVDIAESMLYNLQQYFLRENKTDIECIVADVRNLDRIRYVFENYKPNIVFHASAYKHVPFMEENPYEAVRTNILGSKIIADLSIEFDIDKFVMISTDKAVNPTNVMGASKRIAELYMSCLKHRGKTKFITTRFGNVLGSNGSVIPLFKFQIEKGGPLTVTHKDITRFFMTIPEACRLVLEAGIMGEGGEIFVFDMGKSVKIFDLAMKMIRLSGLRYPDDIDIKITGLRPGEKIYEEVLSDKENTIKTYHNKIMIAKVSPLDKEKVEKLILSLCNTPVDEGDIEIVRCMKSIVPEFKSNNSRFSVLD